MMVKTQFSIKDLENLSGIKAHTLRIWEKRYNLLTPSRTDTNIRKYNLENLKKLLNTTFLYRNGFKISKIAACSPDEISQLVTQEAQLQREHHAIGSFKAAMLGFDNQQFDITYSQLSAHTSFRSVFFEVFLPLLNEIGMLWQTGTIDPAHERFISEKIKQKIIVQIAQEEQKEHAPDAPSFSLYLPYQEIHEIGLLYANYEILSHGFKTVYLGTNIPLQSLKYITKHHAKTTFLSYFTVKPDHESVEQYIDRYQKEICTENSYDLWLFGVKTQDVKNHKLPSNISIFSSLFQLIDKLEKIKKS